MAGGFLVPSPIGSYDGDSKPARTPFGLFVSVESKRLGPYEIGAAIGKGGMGSVHAAVDTQTGRRVAIKALSPQLAQAEGFRERFEAEIESLKTLRHEGIVRLYGYGEEDGTLYYSMELVEGTSLEEELKNRRRFTWREVADIAIQLCRALKHAHDHGVVHRDIKPANILIDENNRVKLADFGIARLFGSTQLTTAGGVLGTADYMSPEQADGRPVTDRCDQYSLGGVMYALLAGRAPFRAKNLPEMLQLQRYAEPEPVRRYAADTPEQLERVIMQLLSKSPAARFPNTIVLARHLEAMVKALSRPAEDDFAVSDHGPRVHVQVGDLDHSLSATRVEHDSDLNGDAESSLASDVESEAASENRDLQDAATLAAPEDNSVSISLDVVPASGDDDSETESQLADAESSSARLPTYTDVEEEARQAELAAQLSPLAFAGQTLGALAALLAIGAFAIWLTRTPSADTLYARISAAAVDDSDFDALREVDDEVETFLEEYPDDPRADEVRSYFEQLELSKLERRLQLLVYRGGDGEDDLLAIERLFVEANELSETKPEQAAAQLESLLALYRGANEENSTNEETAARQQACYRLAVRELAALLAKIAEQAAAQLPELRSRLEHADAMASTDPDGAQTIYQALVDLYGEREWAAEVVDEARTRLVE